MRDVRAWWLVCVAVAAAAISVTPGVPAQGESAPVPRPVLVLPVDGGALVRLASIPEQNWRPGHRGVDIATEPGADVVAPGSGRVVFAGPVAGRDVVTIRLDVGVNATLEPVMASVAVGDRVARGAVVGEVTDAAGHCAPATCVHWGIKHGDLYLDPLDWLVGFGPVVLLPND
jgi:murein DD-endopeptidase MepM/ murein hydrolase activator NlpD